MEENYKMKVWGGRKRLEVRSGKRALWGWGLEIDKEVVGVF